MHEDPPRANAGGGRANADSTRYLDSKKEIVEYGEAQEEKNEDAIQESNEYQIV